MKSKNILAYILIFFTIIFTPRNAGYSVNEINLGKEQSINKIDQVKYSANHSKSVVALKSDSIQSGKTDRIHFETDPEIKLEKPMKSGETTSVPWENDGKFKTAQAMNGCMELMMAYKTVLHDPLPGEEYNVHLAARFLAGTVVKPGEIFSQNNKVGPYTQSRGFQKGPTYVGTQLATTIGGGVCKIASTLYNVTVLSNLQVIERHCHNMPVPYVPYGQDATVSYGAKDFKFKNNTSFPVLIWAQGVDNTLYIGFYGKSKPPKVQWHHETIKVYQASKVYRINPDLPAGMEKVVLEGMDGGVIKSWLTIKNPDGTTSTKQMGKSYYNPMSYIIEKGK